MFFAGIDLLFAHPLNLLIAFDPNVIEIHKDDVQDFLGALNNALKKATPTYFNNNSTTLLNEWK